MLFYIYSFSNEWKKSLQYNLVKEGENTIMI